MQYKEWLGYSSTFPTCLSTSSQLLTCTVPDHPGFRRVKGGEVRHRSTLHACICELTSLLSGLAGVIAEPCSFFPARGFQFLGGLFTPFTHPPPHSLVVVSQLHLPGIWVPGVRKFTVSLLGLTAFRQPF